MDSTNIVVTREGGIARLTLNRPRLRNAMNLALMTELTADLRDVGADPDIAVVIIEGAGPAFSAGHDLREMIDREDAFYAELFAACAAMMRQIKAIPQPVIAKVHGFATAAGCQLVAACDLAVATDDAWFATPGVKIGLFCTTPMVPISRAVGRKRALQMLLTGEPVSAETALGWGLLNQVVPADRLEDVVKELAGQIMRYSRAVIAIGKDAFYRQVDLPEDAAYDVACPIMAGNAAHVDAQEGMGAFLEKRQPVWDTTDSG